MGLNAIPDGASLRLTVAEYLTPSLKHVTKVGNARYDPISGMLVGGGVFPDIYCRSHGIPMNIGADYCVGKALDILQTADISGTVNSGPLSSMEKSYFEEM